MSNIEAMRAGRAAKYVERLVDQEMAKVSEFTEIDAMIDRTFASYDEALRKATARPEDDPALWRKAFELQRAAINASNRKRILARELGEAA